MARTETNRPTDPSRPVILVVVCAFLALLTIAGVKGFRDLRLASSREVLLKQRIEETRDQVLELESDIALLESDPGTLERLAREERLMVRPGDVVILLPDESE